MTLPHSRWIGRCQRRHAQDRLAMQETNRCLIYVAHPLLQQKYFRFDRAHHVRHQTNSESASRSAVGGSIPFLRGASQSADPRKPLDASTASALEELLDLGADRGRDVVLAHGLEGSALRRLEAALAQGE